MAEDADVRWGVARTFTLALGIAYLTIALVEVVLGSDGLVVGDRGSTAGVILLIEPVHNAIHWLTGIVFLGSSLAGASAARTVARAIGVAFLLIAVAGLVAGEATMDLLGYEGAPSVPISYTIVHAVTAIGGIYAGFARGGGVGAERPTPSR